MSIKRLLLLGLGLLVVGATPAAAQENLGDLVTEYGYDWLLGKWAATTDEGQPVELEYRWGLDRHAILVDFTMGDFKYHGMILFIPSREEVVQMGADNRGGVWHGTWADAYPGAAHTMENTRSDGTKEQIQMVHTRADGDAMKIGVYDVDSYGYRGSSQGTLTLKRRPRK